MRKYMALWRKEMARGQGLVFGAAGEDCKYGEVSILAWASEG